VPALAEAWAMASLNWYHQQVTRLLREQRQELVNPDDITEYINRARQETAMRAMCARGLTPVSGSIIGYTLTSGGENYSNSPTLTITAPDFPSGTLPFPNGSQATASAIVSNGVIQSIFSQYGGYGYFEPTITITDTTGTGAAATPIVSYINELQQGQEVYSFSSVNLSLFPGAAAVYMIKSVSILFSGFRYSLACYDMTTYQSLVRQWALIWQYTPVVCAQYGQGTSGSFYMYPIPSQTFQMEWDCFFLPSYIYTDQDFDLIPDPWTNAVPYFALHLAFLELQNFNGANYYLDLFDKMLHRYSTYARPGMRINPYGRP
jgi:hypothetical protein